MRSLFSTQVSILSGCIICDWM